MGKAITLSSVVQSRIECFRQGQPGELQTTTALENGINEKAPVSADSIR